MRHDGGLKAAWAGAAALAALASAPVAASVPQRPLAADAAPMAPEEYRALLARLVPLAQANQCGALLATADPALARIAGKPRDVVQLLRIPCLGATGRGAEVPGVYAEMVAVEPESPMVRSIGVFVAAAGGDFPTAGTRLASLAEDHPESLGSITSGLARGITQALTQSHQLALRDRMTLALARADWQPEDRPDMRDALAANAIQALLARSEVDEAGTLLPRITAPELLASMAIERRYQPLWPAIEARLGPHAGTAIDPFVVPRLDAYTRNPIDERALHEATRAFVLLGRLPEAIELGGQVRITDGIGEDAIATIGYQAQALAARGDRAAAIARMEPFTALDVARTPDAVSGLIDLAELLDESGREAEALSVARTTLAKGGAALSPWGAAWARRTVVCALGALGRVGEAKTEGDALAARSGDNQAAAIEGLLCAGRRDEAARIAIDALGTAEGASGLADQFQPQGAFWAAAPSRLRALWSPLLARPDVRAAFDRRLRILPKPLWPDPAPRPIPRAPGAPTGANVT